MWARILASSRNDISGGATDDLSEGRASPFQGVPRVIRGDEGKVSSSPWIRLCLEHSRLDRHLLQLHAVSDGMSDAYDQHLQTSSPAPSISNPHSICTSTPAAKHVFIINGSDWPGTKALRPRGWTGLRYQAAAITNDALLPLTPTFTRPASVSERTGPAM